MPVSLDITDLFLQYLFVQSSKEKLRRGRDIYLQPPAEECCADCLLVRKRAAASNDARAAWNEQWEMVSSRRLEALEQGHPLPPLTLPYLELRLPEGVPEELPPSLNRCSACQDLLDKVRVGGTLTGWVSRSYGAGRRRSGSSTPPHLLCFPGPCCSSFTMSRPCA